MPFLVIAILLLSFHYPTIIMYIYCYPMCSRHALPLFTSLLNVVCSYDPIGYGVPYNHLMVADNREPLVEIALQVLCVSLEDDLESGNTSPREEDQEPAVSA